MQINNFANKKWFAVFYLGFLFFLGLIFYNVFKNETGSNVVMFPADTGSFSKSVENNFPLPVNLKIPKINVNATIEYVGLATDGSIDVPKSPTTVAWFNLSSRPGEPGNSIIDGHSGYKNNTPAVFDNLYKLEKGDKIYIENKNGLTITFVVHDVHSYSSDKSLPGVFISSDGASHLNLITCSGIWSDKEKTHSSRLVVFTDKEIEK